ncbi:MAG: 3-deoxy-D-manno-octulosonic acid transferase [Chlamydiales bacterium]|nr:3-deoxy-D-manno-octulosonic acid transferase [Chlamydiales bacterium]
MFFSVVYTIALHLFALLMIPSFLYGRIRYRKYQKSFSCRMGKHFPQIDKQGRFLIWVHAVSVGETSAVAPLVKKMKKSLPDAIIVFSNITETGHDEALKSIKEADYHLFLPFDLPYIIRPIVQQVKPDLVILTETDFWFHFQDAAKDCGAKIVVVNGKISRRSLKRYRMLPWFTAPLFQSLDLVCVQSEAYRKRFINLAIPPDHLIVTGNLKLDDTYAEASKEELASWKEKLGIEQNDKILVIGSSHDPEEKLLLSQLKKVWKKMPELKVFLVPRHPERCRAVEAILRKQKVSFALWSREEKFDKMTHLLLVDAMGVLRKLYQLGDLAIVAGSYTSRIGGHNLLEPSWYGKPVIYGPYVYAQKNLNELLKQKGASTQVPIDALADTIVHLFSDKELMDRMGRHGKEIFEEAKGATDKTWEEIRQILP